MGREVDVWLQTEFLVLYKGHNFFIRVVLPRKTDIQCNMLSSTYASGYLSSAYCFSDVIPEMQKFWIFQRRHPTVVGPEVVATLQQRMKNSIGITATLRLKQVDTVSSIRGNNSQVSAS